MDHLDLHSPITRKLIALIASSFLLTFVIARLFVYLVLGHLMPNFFLTIRGVHIHHFTYGVFILVLVGLFLILKRPEFGSNRFTWATWWYGVGLGLTFDEFGMWIRLQDDYWVRQSYDAIIIVTLALLNIAYFKPLVGALKELLTNLKDFLRRFL
jgi:glucan phosphoethanolaminetransferase (alkaline phosphatase superfamily)